MLCDEKTMVTVMKEILKGSRSKYEYDEETQSLKFDRMLSQRFTTLQS